MSEQATIYLNFTVDEMRRFVDADVCHRCGGKHPSDKCYARKCDSCTEVWLSDTLADLEEFDIADRAVRDIRMEDCPPCVTWLATVHLSNDAPSFVYGDQ